MTCILCKEVVFDLDLIETDCKHWFLKACLQNWLHDINTCPTCSQSQMESNPNSVMVNRMMPRSTRTDNQNNTIVFMKDKVRLGLGGTLRPQCVRCDTA